MLFNGQEGLPVAEMSPWVDLRVPPKHVKLPQIEAISHRRFLKTHLPVDALVFNPKVKYIYSGRDGRDIVWSLYNHHFNANEKWYGALNDTPGRVGPPIDPPPAFVVDYYLDWLNKDGFPFWSFWDNVRTWWEIRNLTNVQFVHFANLKADLPTRIREIAQFLDITIDESKFEDILLHCSFEYMKAHADKSVPLGGLFWDKGAKVFMNKGKNGRWKDILSPEQSQLFEDMAVEKLGQDCAHWVITGEMS